MRQKVFTLFSAASLLICIAVAGMWLRGRTDPRQVGLIEFTWRGIRRSIDVGPRGFELSNRPELRIRLVRSRTELDEIFPAYVAAREPSEDPVALKAAEDEFGMRIHGASHSVGTYEGILRNYKWPAVPFAVVVLTTASPPAAWLAGRLLTRLKQKRRHRGNRCVRCGYDLRATPERCPECGCEPRPAHPDQRPDPDSSAPPVQEKGGE